MKPTDELTQTVIGAAIEVHRRLGPGLLESVYEECLCHEFAIRGLAFRRQVPLPVTYKDVTLACGFKADIVIPERLILELKASERLLPLYTAQLITYLRLTGIPIGLLINFNVTSLRQGIRRIALNRHQGGNET